MSSLEIDCGKRGIAVSAWACPGPRRPGRAAVLTGVLCSLGAQAQTPAAKAPAPRGTQRVGQTVADRPSAVYRFETHRLDSADGKRHYRRQIVVPRQPAPAGGSPVRYLLDGNAALDTLTDADLSLLGEGVTPILAAVGYDVPTRNDVVARALRIAVEP